MRITDFLSFGKENAQPGKALAQLLGINIRELSLRIETERRSGEPICATTDGKNPGYYLARNKQEMQEYCQSLHRRAAEIYKTRQECLKTLEKLPEA